MCAWGTHETLRLVVDESVSHTGCRRTDDVKVDACIAGVIRALNENGVRTVNSCCGHGCGEALILLASGGRISLAMTVEDSL